MTDPAVTQTPTPDPRAETTDTAEWTVEVHNAHNLRRLERGRPLTDVEVACYIADHQTALRHATADVGDEIAEMLRDRLRVLAEAAPPVSLPESYLDEYPALAQAAPPSDSRETLDVERPHPIADPHHPFFEAPDKARGEVREYRKTATVLAGVALLGGVIPTLEGDHSFEAGDYICGPGAAGEFWPVKRSIFEATYAARDTPVADTETAGEAG